MNTRFGILLEDISKSSNKKEKKEKVKEIYYKDNKDKHREGERKNSDKYDSKYNRYRDRDNYETRKNKLDKNVSKTIIFNLDDSSFPELVANSKIHKDTETLETNYLDATMTEKNKTINLEEEKRKVGWIYYVKDINTCKIVVEDYSTTCSILKKEENYNYIYKQICDKYTEWKNKYIQTWGYDEYKKLYLFPNYDYEYFDRLDLYEYEIDENNSDRYESDEDFYVNKDEY